MITIYKNNLLFCTEIQKSPFVINRNNNNYYCYYDVLDTSIVLYIHNLKVISNMSWLKISFSFNKLNFSLIFSINYSDIKFLESTLTNMVDDDHSCTKMKLTFLKIYIVHNLHSTN